MINFTYRKFYLNKILKHPEVFRLQKGKVIMKKVGITVSIIGVILVIAGIVQKSKKSMAISIIGGADGPTSIFLAGKSGSMPAITAMVAGIIMLIIGVFLIMRRK